MLEPLAVSDADRLLLCPTVTLPKLNVDGLTANWPATVAVPAMEIVKVELDASETTEIDPVALPPDVGANTAPKVKLCPALKVRGRLNPVTLKPVPETVAWVTVVVPPVLVKSRTGCWCRHLNAGEIEAESLVLNARPCRGARQMC
jgi:hypothetical protein